MDQAAAYKLLCEEMGKLAQLDPDQLNKLQESDLELSRQGPDGIRYSLILVVEPLGNDRFIVVGNIHDNSSYQFSLLEERLEFTSRWNGS